MTDWAKVQALEVKAQVAAMTQELTQKSEEIRKDQAEQAVLLSTVWELVGHPGDIVNKAHLYDQLMESADSSSARQTLQILVKYSRSMKDWLKEIQKFLPPCGTPRRMLDPGPPGLPTITLYEVIGEGVGPSQPAGTSRTQESGRVSDPKQIPVHQQANSSQVRKNSTKRLARSGHGPSPGQARASK